jgi:UDPglucose 6-dehydrogenase
MDFIVKNHINKNLFFTSDMDFVIRNSDIIFICVNTPTKEFGIGSGQATNLSFIEDCFKKILDLSGFHNKIIIQKSTVPVGTSENLFRIARNLKKKHCIISSPEFLAEGSAIKNLLNPDRVLLGLLETKFFKKTRVYLKEALNLIYKLYTK